MSFPPTHTAKKVAKPSTYAHPRLENWLVWCGDGHPPLIQGSIAVYWYACPYSCRVTKRPSGPNTRQKVMRTSSSDGSYQGPYRLSVWLTITVSAERQRLPNFCSAIGTYLRRVTKTCAACRLAAVRRGL